MLDFEYQRERYADLRREAEQERLLRSIQRSGHRERRLSAVQARILLSIGRVMVDVGSRLEQLGAVDTEYADEVG